MALASLCHLGLLPLRWNTNMAKIRVVNTRFWIDDYISELDPIEKLLFLYLITNPATEISGVYELPIKVMAVQTGIDKDMVIKILKRFEKDKKIVHKDGWVVVTNFSRHQTNNPSVQKGIDRSLAEIPSKIRFIYDKIQSGDSLSQSALLKPKLKPKLKPTEQTQSANSLVPEIIKLFETINPTCKTYYANTTQRGACQFLLDTYGFEKVKSVIENTLPKSNGLEFFPNITTPVQLRDKWASLENSVKNYQNKKKSEQTKKGNVYL